MNMSLLAQYYGIRVAMRRIAHKHTLVLHYYACNVLSQSRGNVLIKYGYLFLSAFRIYVRKYVRQISFDILWYYNR